MHGEHRVLGPPGRRLDAERQVLERLLVERREPRVHPLGIGLEERALGRPGHGYDPARHVAEAVQAVGPIDLERQPAEQLRELAGGAAPQQVHLKEAVLGMDEAECPRHVGQALAADRRHAERVALDRDRGAEAGDGPLAVELRQARREPAAQPEPAAEHGKGEKGDHDREDGERPPEPAAPGPGAVDERGLRWDGDGLCGHGGSRDPGILCRSE